MFCLKCPMLNYSKFHSFMNFQNSYTHSLWCNNMLLVSLHISPRETSDSKYKKEWFSNNQILELQFYSRPFCILSCGFSLLPRKKSFSAWLVSLCWKYYIFRMPERILACSSSIQYLLESSTLTTTTASISISEGDEDSISDDSSHATPQQIQQD